MLVLGLGRKAKYCNLGLRDLALVKKERVKVLADIRWFWKKNYFQIHVT